MKSDPTRLARDRLIRYWRFLVAAHPDIEDIVKAHQSRMLAIALVTLTAVFACVDLVLWLSVPSYTPPWYGYLFLIATYALNRLGYSAFAAFVAMAMFPTVVFAQIYEGTASDPLLTLGYLSLTPVLATILLPVWGITLAAIVNVVGLMLVPGLIPELGLNYSGLVGPISVNVIAAVIAVAYVHQRDRIEVDRGSALADREQRLRLALDGANMGTWDWHIGEDFAVLSPRAREILGLADDAPLTLETYLDRTDPRDQTKVAEMMQNLVRTGQPEVHLEHRIDVGGQTRWVELRGSAFDASGDSTTVRVIGVLADVTERRTAQEEKRRLEAQLQQAQKMEAIGRLTGGIAHDFNNLITVILGNAGICQGSSPSVEADEIMAAARSAAALTRQLLAFARKAEGKIESVDLGKAVERGTAMLRRTIGPDVQISVSKPEDLWFVALAENQAEQILLNLGTNARDAMPYGGKISIELRNVVLDETDIGGHDLCPGSYVELSVSDSGSGMDEETLARAFEPFFTTKDRGKGTGLGLAMVFGVVNHAKGFIRVESSPRKGTSFHIYLPRRTPPGPSIEKTPDAPSRHTGKESILVVEDEPALARLVRLMLIEAGYRVTVAASPDEALEMVRSSAPIDLILTDVLMPIMPGPELAAIALQHRPRVAVLYMTGYAPQGTVDGMSDVLTKPFDRDQLNTKVRQVLDRSRTPPLHV